MPEKKNETVLIIDDDAFLIEMYALKFSQKGFQVESALGTPQALEKLTSGGVHPDIIVCDIVMPVMDGLEFLEKAKKENLAPGSIMVVLSNLGQDTDIERAMKVGVDGYVVKASATPSEVVEKVEEIIKRKRASEEKRK